MLYKLIANTLWYPWLMAIMAMLIVTTSNGMINSGITVFDESLLKEFGWQVSELKLRDSITFLGASVFVLIAGWLVDRFGYKPLLMFGMAVLACAYYAYSFIDSLQDIYLIHVMFALVAGCAGNMAAIVLAANSLPHRRGLAVGMAIAGTSIGGMLIPPLASWLNESVGWRDSVKIEALIPLCMLIAITLLVKNNRSPQNVQKKPQEGVPFAQVIRDRRFYLIALAGACTYYAILSLYSHLFLYMRSLDFSPQQASFGLSVLSLAALSGKLISGWLSDVINPYRFFKLLMTVMLIGLAGLSQFPAWIWGCLLVTGFGWGGLHTLYNFILISLFGLRDAGKINGSVSVAEGIGGGVGIFMTGLIYDLNGNYTEAFLSVVAMMFVGCLVIWTMNLQKT